MSAEHVWYVFDGGNPLNTSLPEILDICYVSMTSLKYSWWWKHAEYRFSRILGWFFYVSRKSLTWLRGWDTLYPCSPETLDVWFGQQDMSDTFVRVGILLIPLHKYINTGRFVRCTYKTSCPWPIDKLPALKTSHSQNFPQLKTSHSQNIPSLNVPCP